MAALFKRSPKLGADPALRYLPSHCRTYIGGLRLDATSWQPCQTELSCASDTFRRPGGGQAEQPAAGCGPLIQAQPQAGRRSGPQVVVSRQVQLSIIALSSNLHPASSMRQLASRRPGGGQAEQPAADGGCPVQAQPQAGRRSSPQEPALFSLHLRWIYKAAS